MDFRLTPALAGDLLADDPGHISFEIQYIRGFLVCKDNEFSSIYLFRRLKELVGKCLTHG